MQDNELFRVVQPPEDRPLRAVIEAAAKIEADKLNLTNKTLIKYTISKHLHRWFGVHYWVRWREYDQASGRFIDTRHQICCFCPTGR